MPRYGLTYRTLPSTTAARQPYRRLDRAMRQPAAEAGKKEEKKRQETVQTMRVLIEDLHSQPALPCLRGRLTVVGIAAELDYSSQSKQSRNILLEGRFSIV
jgi:ATP-dependent protease Clp ATPase subunit